jgi:hypothetical protein
MSTKLRVVAGSVLKEGDTEPNFEAQCLDGDAKFEDLSSINSVTFHLKQVGAPTAKITSSMTVVDPSKGHVKYEWADDGSDTDTPGVFDAEVEVEDSDGETTTYPGGGYVTVQIEEQLA